jgi:hypothetical protein
MKNTLILAAGLLVGCGAAPGSALMAGDDAVRPSRRVDPIEAVRLLRRAALEGDGEACRDWLARVGARDVTVSQRMDARLTVADLLARGALPDRGRSAELHYRLAWSWMTEEPRSAAAAAAHAAAYRRAGGTSTIPATSDPSQVLQPTVVHWLAEEAGTVWGGGHDRLYLTTGLLAFLTNERGEPAYRGTHLRVRNAGKATVYVTARSAGEFHRELKAGEEFLRPVDLQAAGGGRFVTGVDVTVRLSPSATSAFASGR